MTEDGARNDLDRAQELFAQGLLSQKELDDRKSAYDRPASARSSSSERLELLKSGRARIEDREVSTRIVAPVTGTVLTLEVHPGRPGRAAHLLPGRDRPDDDGRHERA